MEYVTLGITRLRVSILRLNDHPARLLPLPCLWRNS
jgi:hypothetical protein